MKTCKFNQNSVNQNGSDDMLNLTKNKKEAEIKVAKMEKRYTN